VYYKLQTDVDSSDDISAEFQKINSSKIVLACVSRCYQDNFERIAELREANKSAETVVVTVFLEPDSSTWKSAEINELCQLDVSSAIVCDVGDVAGNPIWDSDEGADQATLDSFDTAFSDTLSKIKDYVKRS
jgi:hypothetical protein